MGLQVRTRELSQSLRARLTSFLSLHARRSNRLKPDRGSQRCDEAMGVNSQRQLWYYIPLITITLTFTTNTRHSPAARFSKWSNSGFRFKMQTSTLALRVCVCGI